MEPLILGDNRLETQTPVAKEPKGDRAKSPSCRRALAFDSPDSNQGRRAVTAACREHHSKQDRQLSDSSSLAGLLLTLFA